ncbi:hypothetical protein KP509_14G022000 [Ceratopteris richardii]|uniref:Uncharacterized protein n=1 Tax=Ceratopteris richardii TaxID=49495 RepID=A0A8T2TB80_CERRI|nr:hypothetical protein KP509_14G022000 [Ceratopteris richardii]
MGGTPSKEELLYQEVRNGNHDAVKSLRRQGTSLEWKDKQGRTPLLLACSRSELLDMSITLLNLGANTNAYGAGAHGGYPLHYACKEGLDKTVTLLLTHGANPFAVNDSGQTALDMARKRGHANVVRVLEDRLCIFSGIVRKVSGSSILEFLAPNLMTRKVWAVVLPHKLNNDDGTPEYELALYVPPKFSLWNALHASSAHPAGLCNVSQPQSVIILRKAEIQEPDFTLADPVLIITENAHKMIFFSEKRGDKEQLKRLQLACQLMFQIRSSDSSSREDDPMEQDHDNVIRFHVSISESSCSEFPLVRQEARQLDFDESLQIGMPVKFKHTILKSTSECATVVHLHEPVQTAIACQRSVSPEASSTYLNGEQKDRIPYNGCSSWGRDDRYTAQTSYRHSHEGVTSQSSSSLLPSLLMV